MHEADGSRDIFDERGARDDDAMVAWPDVRDEEFGFVVALARPRPGEVVMDVPSGGGYLARHLPDTCSVVAVLPSASFVERSRARGLHSVTGPMADPPVACESIGLVVSVAGMHHADDHAGLLAGWAARLRPASPVTTSRRWPAGPGSPT